MAENDPLDPVQLSFFYANAPANSPLSYQSLLTRRKIAEALLSKRTALPFPKNLGEGLTYASDRLASAFGDRDGIGASGCGRARIRCAGQARYAKSS